MRRTIEWLILAAGVGSLALAVTATTVRAENPGAQVPMRANGPAVRNWLGGLSSVELHAPQEPGAVATLTFHNSEVHNGSEDFTLTWNGIDVVVVFTWQYQDTPAERVCALPPDGFVAIPECIVVDEKGVESLSIYAAAPGA